MLKNPQKAVVIDFSRNTEEQWRKLVTDITVREKHLEELQRKWKIFNTLLSSVTTWVQKADVLIKGFDFSKCKVSSNFYVKVPILLIFYHLDEK